MRVSSGWAGVSASRAAARLGVADSGEDGAVEVGLDALEAAFVPVGADEGIDVEVLVGGLGMVGVVIGFGEFPVFGGIFAGEDEARGVEAMFEGVEAAGGFARFGARSGGFERVGSVGGDLSRSCHDLAITCGQAGFWGGGL